MMHSSVVWVSERAYVNNSGNIKPRRAQERALESPVCLQWHNVNSFDLRTKLGKGLMLALT